MTDAPPIDAVYDRIASHFAATREHPWPEVESFLEEVGGRHGLDIGCGNGRHTELLSQVVELAMGVDVSGELIDLARERSHERGYAAEFLHADGTHLPLEPDSIDVGLYIATIHHLRPHRARVASLDELARVLSPDGIALVSAWSTQHERFEETSGFDTTIEWTLQNDETVSRFYHIYDPVEFREDIQASDLELLHSFVSNGNCYARVRASSGERNTLSKDEN